MRLGDPETQPLMHRMESDFVPALMAAARAGLPGTSWTGTPGRASAWCWPRAAIPAHYETGKEIRGVETGGSAGAPRSSTPGRGWLHGRLETSGGRVLGVTAPGADLPAAIDDGLRSGAADPFEGMHYRHDIGRKASAKRH